MRTRVPFQAHAWVSVQTCRRLLPRPGSCPGRWLLPPILLPHHDGRSGRARSGSRVLGACQRQASFSRRGAGRRGDGGGGRLWQRRQAQGKGAHSSGGDGRGGGRHAVRGTILHAAQEKLSARAAMSMTAQHPPSIAASCPGVCTEYGFASCCQWPQCRKQAASGATGDGGASSRHLPAKWPRRCRFAAPAAAAPHNRAASGRQLPAGR